MTRLKEPGEQVAMSEVQREVYCKVADTVKGINLQVPKAISGKFLDTCEDPYLTVFTMAGCAKQ